MSKTAAQQTIDSLTADNRNEIFGEDRQAWFECFANLWTHLTVYNKKVSVASLGQSKVGIGTPYGTTFEMRPSKIISSNRISEKFSNYEYAIMVKDSNSNGEGPYVMVQYCAVTGDELARIDL